MIFNACKEKTEIHNTDTGYIIEMKNADYRPPSLMMFVLLGQLIVLEENLNLGRHLRPNVHTDKGQTNAHDTKCKRSKSRIPVP